MKKLFTFVLFVFVLFVFSASNLEAQGRARKSGGVVSFEVAPCPGDRPIFFVRQVSNFLLDPGYSSSSSGGSRVYIGVASSRRSASTVSQQWMNPQLMLEAFNREFQNDGCVGAIDNRVRETGGFNSFYVNAVKALNYDIPATKDPKVYFPVISGKVLQTRNTIKFGPSKKQQVAGAVIEAGTVVLACRRSGDLEDGLCVAGQLAAQILLAGSKNTERRAQRMEVTIQFQNAGTGYLQTLTGETGDFYTSEDNEVVVFLNHTSGRFEVHSMKEALVEAMEKIKTEFVAANRP